MGDTPLFGFGNWLTIIKYCRLARKTYKVGHNSCLWILDVFLSAFSDPSQFLLVSSKLPSSIHLIPQHRKMTLYQLTWTIFDVDPKSQIEGFVVKIKEAASSEPETASIPQETSGTFTRRGGRLNTKLRQQATLQDLGKGNSDDNFWDQHFQSESEIPWYKFQQCFLEDYESHLSGRPTFL